MPTSPGRPKTPEHIPAAERGSVPAPPTQSQKEAPGSHPDLDLGLSSCEMMHFLCFSGLCRSTWSGQLVGTNTGRKAQAPAIPTGEHAPLALASLPAPARGSGLPCTCRPPSGDGLIQGSVTPTWEPGSE